MSQNQIDPSSQKKTPSDSSSFLGGGPKFNQAGLNTPLPGEKTAEADKVALFGGPRVWIGAVVIIALVAFLWIYVGDGLSGTAPRGNAHTGIDIGDAPDVNSDAPPR
jgi:hypothetical protein